MRGKVHIVKALRELRLNNHADILDYIRGQDYEEHWILKCCQTEVVEALEVLITQLKETEC